jgi:hypothetical protein
MSGSVERAQLDGYMTARAASGISYVVQSGSVAAPAFEGSEGARGPR